MIPEELDKQIWQSKKTGTRVEREKKDKKMNAMCGHEGENVREEM